ncbi:hypothetical protein OsJ_09972 [Oryza sativa Japonica Group]|uniref:Uncharacterized protein n=1 Tax=Oryza sativa subsp. japonica TaxID=39947 RepID=B9F6A2_ORYSJ|nr:hypothetical protein OsJ_09972 [Oryza sativa Japonica Group]
MLQKATEVTNGSQPLDDPVTTAGLLLAQHLHSLTPPDIGPRPRVRPAPPRTPPAAASPWLPASPSSYAPSDNDAGRGHEAEQEQAPSPQQPQPTPPPRRPGPASRRPPPTSRPSCRPSCRPLHRQGTPAPLAARSASIAPLTVPTGSVGGEARSGHRGAGSAAPSRTVVSTSGRAIVGVFRPPRAGAGSAEPFGASPPPSRHAAGFATGELRRRRGGGGG